MPKNRVEGEIVHIYKEKGGNRRMCILQPNMPNANNIQNMAQLLTHRLTKTIHAITINNASPNRRCNTKIEPKIERQTPNTHLLLVDLTNAFGKVNSAKLRATLYKKGIPIETISHIRRGHPNKTIKPKRKGTYGKQENNVGASQGSAISALVFIIYLDDMMEAYEALNIQKQMHPNTPERKTE